MSDSLKDYFNALDRLISDKPRILPSGTKITNDSVSLEAGRGKGSIKKSRPIFSDLIEAIRLAGENQYQNKSDLKDEIVKAKKSTLNYKKMYEESIGRELSLIYEIDQLKQTIRELTDGRVASIISKK